MAQAATPSSVCVRSRSIRKYPYDAEMPSSPPCSRRSMPTSRSGSLTPGSGRSSTLFMALKIVVTAPAPSEITSTAIRVNTGLLRSIRMA